MSDIIPFSPESEKARKHWLSCLVDKCPCCGNEARLTTKQIDSIPPNAETFWFDCNEDNCSVICFNNDTRRIHLKSHDPRYLHILAVFAPKEDLLWSDDDE